MPTVVISGEITAVSGKRDEAARRLQELGFRVHRVDATISVDAPKRTWERVFHMTFRRWQQKRLRRIPESSVTVWEPARAPVVPKALQGAVTSVVFPPPPELF